MTEETVYFLHNPRAGAVKIGFSRRILKRIQALKAGSVDPLDVLGTADGTRENEKQIHRMLVKHRIQGEWFRDHEDVLALAEKVSKGGIEAIGLSMEPELPPEPEPEPQDTLPARQSTSHDDASAAITALGRIQDHFDRKAILKFGYY